jgi:hypothetical protein
MLREGGWLLDDNNNHNHAVDQQELKKVIESHAWWGKLASPLQGLGGRTISGGGI